MTDISFEKLITHTYIGDNLQLEIEINNKIKYFALKWINVMKICFYALNSLYIWKQKYFLISTIVSERS